MKGECASRGFAYVIQPARTSQNPHYKSTSALTQTRIKKYDFPRDLPSDINYNKLNSRFGERGRRQGDLSYFPSTTARTNQSQNLCLGLPWLFTTFLVGKGLGPVEATAPWLPYASRMATARLPCVAHASSASVRWLLAGRTRTGTFGVRAG